MSQPGSTIEISELEDGASWVLIAHSAMTHLSGVDGIMAGSRDIADIIENDKGDGLFIFPDESDAPGLYLWTGKIIPDDDEDFGFSCLGSAELIHPSSMQHWLDHNCE